MTVDNVEQASYEVRVSSQNVIQQRVSIKHGDCFVLSDRRGDIPPHTESGFYVGGTRHLSAFDLRVEGGAPLLLSSSLADDDVQLVSVQTNPDLTGEDGHPVPHQAVLFARELTVQGNRFHSRIEVRSFHTARLAFTVEVHFAADFIDIFEVRGYRRDGHGERFPPELDRDQVTLTYRGLDEVVRRSIVKLEPAPDVLEGGRAAWHLSLAPAESRVLEVAVSGGLVSAVEVPVADERKAAAKVRKEQVSWDRSATRFFTSSERLNRLLDRANADTRLMCTKTSDGIIPYAGVPWYACPFGRDSLWTSLMTLPLLPKISAGTLRYLARRQAESFDDFVDSEPGKILHEMRTGEMANLREIPFIPYYGTVDATPLFVVLLDRYVRWTGDRDLEQQLWPNAKAALEWIRGPGDIDGDGFLEYQRRSPVGLSNQGWKDSSDSIFHRDGTIPDGPIALVEAQAYSYAAMRAGARLADSQGDRAYATGLRERAAKLQVRFEEAFWSEERKFYAIALDGKKRRCDVISSNAGHALWSGIVSDERAEIVGEKMLSRSMFSGWGVRTLAEGEARYNPMSYHDGSIWPHDNAILAAGLKRYGLRDAAGRVATAVLDAGQMFEENRIPELYCGFPRLPRLAPTPYPVACRPQAWSAATAFALLDAMLGLEVDGAREALVFDRPSLPHWLDWVEITNLAAGSKHANVRLERTTKGGASIARSFGDAKVTIRK